MFENLPLRRMSKVLGDTGRLILISAMIWSSFFWSFAQGQEIILDPSGNVGFRPTVNRTQPAPTVNIARPNSGGVSVNKYQEFNVGKNGAVLNNSSSATQTQINGQIAANPNLVAGQEARTIVNEVTSSISSQLLGATEVAGQSAHVIVANPNGVTCDGCAFINTDEITLSTGVPIVDGSDVTLDVKRGTVTIGRGGLNGASTGVNGVNLIGRSVSVDGTVTANGRIRTVGGAQQFNLSTGESVSQQGSGQAPQFVVDGTAFGAMRAGQIEVIGTENGLGVRTRGALQATTASVTVAGQGDTTVRTARAEQNVTVRGRDRVEIERDLSARAELEVAGRTIVSYEDSGFFGDLGVSIEATESTTILGEVQTQKDFNVSAPAVVFGALVRGSGEFKLNADHVDFDGATIISGKLFQPGELKSFTLNNTSFFTPGAIIDAENVTLGQANYFDDNGATYALSASDTFTNAADLRPLTNVDLSFGENLVNTETGVFVHPDVELSFSGEITNQGVVIAEEGQSFEAFDISNFQNAAILGSDLALTTRDDLSNDGLVFGEGVVAVAVEDRLDNTGVIRGATLSITAGEFVNETGSAVTMPDGSIVVGGQVVADSVLTIGIDGALSNSGDLYSQDSLTVSSGTLLTNAGRIDALSEVAASADQLINSSGAIFNSGGTLDLTASSELRNDGVISAEGQITLIGDDLVRLTSGSVALSKSNIAIITDLFVSEPGSSVIAGIADLTNPEAGFGSEGELIVTADEAQIGGILQAAEGQVYDLAGAFELTGYLISNRDIDLNARAITVNAEASIEALGDVTLTSRSDLINSGTVTAGSALVATAAGQVTNSGKMIGNSLSLKAGDVLVNRGLISGNRVSLDTGSDLSNSSGGRVIANDAIIAQVDGNFVNDGQISSGGSVDLDVAGFAENRGGGQMVASGGFVLETGAYLQNAGRVSAGGSLSLVSGGTLSNEAGAVLVAGQDLILNTPEGILAGAVTAGGVLQFNGGDFTISEGASVLGGGLKTDATSLIVSGVLGLDNVGRDAVFDLSGRLGVTETGQIFTTGGIGGSVGNLSVASGGQIVVGQTDLRDPESALTAQNLSLAISGGASLDGLILTGGSAYIAVAGDVSQTGRLIARHDVILSGGSLSNSGTIEAGRDLFVSSATDLDQTGTLFAGQDLRIEATGAFTNRNLANAGRDLTIIAGSVVNAETGELSAERALSAVMNGDFLNAGAVLASTTSLDVGGAFTATAGSTQQSDDALSIVTGSAVFETGSNTVSGGSLNVSADTVLDIRSTLASRGQAQLTGLETISLSTEAAVLGGGNLSLSGGALLTSDGSQMLAGRDFLSDPDAVQETPADIIFDVERAELAGVVDATRDVLGTAGDLVLVETGSIRGGDRFDVSVQSQATISGELSAGATGRFNTEGTAILTSSALVLTGDDFTLSGGNFETLAGSQVLVGYSGDVDALSADAALIFDLSGNALLGGFVKSGGDTQGAIAGDVALSGYLEAVADVDLRLGALDVAETGRLLSGGTMDIAVRGDILNAGRLEAVETQTIAAEGSLQNDPTGVILTGADLTLDIQEDLTNLGFVQGTTGILAGVGGSGINGADAFVISEGTIDLTFGQDLENLGVVQADGALELDLGGTLLNREDALIRAIETLSILAAGDLENAGNILGDSDITAGVGDALTNAQTGLISSAEDLTLDFGGDGGNAGRILSNAQGDIGFGGGFTQAETGVVVTTGALSLQAADLFDNSGLVQAGQGLDLSAGALENRETGTVLSASDATLTVSNGARNAGLIQSLTSVDLSVGGDFENLDDARVLANTTLNVDTGGSTENAGLLASEGVLLLQTVDAFVQTQTGTTLGDDSATLVISSRFENAGRVQAGTDLAVSASTFDNLSTGVVLGGMAVDMDVSESAQNAGIVQSRGRLDLTTGGALLNSQTGQILSEGAQVLTAGGALENAGIAFTNNTVTLDITGNALNSGLIEGATGLSLTVAADLENIDGAAILTGGSASLSMAGALLNAGDIAAAEAMALRVESQLENAATGLIQAGTTLDLDILAAGQNAGVIFSQDEMDANFAMGFIQSETGSIVSEATLALAVAELFDNAGRVQSQSDATLDLGRFENRETGWVLSEAALTMTVAGDAVNSGDIQSVTAMELTTGGGLDNTETGQVYAQERMVVSVGTDLENAGQIASEGPLTATVENDLSNREDGIFQSARAMDLSVIGSVRNDGDILSSDRLTADIDGSLIQSETGTFVSAGTMDITVAGTADNAGAVQTGATLTLIADSLLNREAGVFLSIADAAFTIAADLENAGLIDSRALLDASIAGSLLNAESGIVLSSDAMALDVAVDVINSGRFQTAQTMDVMIGGTFENRETGLVQSETALTLQAVGAGTNNGAVIGGDSVALQFGESFTQGATGTIISGGSGTLEVATLFDNAGLVQTDDTLKVDAEELRNRDTGIIYSDSAQTITIAENTLNEGLIYSADTFDLTSGGFENQATITSVANMSLTTTSGPTVNAGLIGTEGAFVGTFTDDFENRTDAVLKSAETLSIDGGENLSNAGTIATDDALEITLDGGLSQSETGLMASAANTVLDAAGLFENSGVVQSGSELDLKAGRLSNAAGGVIFSVSDLTAEIASDVRNNGTLQSQGELSLLAATLENTSLIASEGVATIEARDASGAGITNSGIVQGNDDLTILSAAALANSGNVQTRRTLNVSGTSLGNSGVLAAGGLNLNVTGDANNNGTVSILGQLIAEIEGQFTNSGLVEAGEQGRVNLNAGDITNIGRVLAGGPLLHNGGFERELVGSGGGSIDLIAADGFVNRDLIQSATSVQTSAGGDLVNSASGVIYAGSGATVTASGNVTNDGTVFGSSLASVRADGTLTNRGQVQSDGQVSTKGGSGFVNEGSGQIISSQDIVISTSGAFTNNSLIQTEGVLTVSAGSVDLKSGSVTAAAGDVSVSASGHGSIDGVLHSFGGNLSLSGATLAIASNGATPTLYSAGSMTLSGNTEIAGIVSAGGDFAMNGDLLLDASAAIYGVAASFTGASTIDGQVITSGDHSYQNLLLGSGGTVYSSEGGIYAEGGQFDGTMVAQTDITLDLRKGVDAGYVEASALEIGGNLQTVTGNIELYTYDDIRLPGADQFVWAGAELIVQAGQALENLGVLYAGTDASIFGQTIENDASGIIYGQNVYVYAGKPVSLGFEHDEDGNALYGAQLAEDASLPGFMSEGAFESGEAFVAALYSGLLGRAPGEAGLAYWKGEFDAGKPVEQLITDFISGAGTGDVEAIVAAMTQELLGRAPQAHELTNWGAAFGTIEGEDRSFSNLIETIHRDAAGPGDQAALAANGYGEGAGLFDGLFEEAYLFEVQADAGTINNSGKIVAADVLQFVQVEKELINTGLLQGNKVVFGTSSDMALAYERKPEPTIEAHSFVDEVRAGVIGDKLPIENPFGATEFKDRAGIAVQSEDREGEDPSNVVLISNLDGGRVEAEHVAMVADEVLNFGEIISVGSFSARTMEKFTNGNLVYAGTFLNALSDGEVFNGFDGPEFAAGTPRLLSLGDVTLTGGMSVQNWGEIQAMGIADLMAVEGGVINRSGAPGTGFVRAGITLADAENGIVGGPEGSFSGTQMVAINAQRIGLVEGTHVNTFGGQYGPDVFKLAASNENTLFDLAEDTSLTLAAGETLSFAGNAYIDIGKVTLADQSVLQAVNEFGVWADDGIENIQGQILAGAVLDLTARSGDILNQSGLIISNGDLSLEAEAGAVKNVHTTDPILVAYDPARIENTQYVDQYRPSEHGFVDLNERGERTDGFTGEAQNQQLPNGAPGGDPSLLESDNIPSDNYYLSHRRENEERRTIVWDTVDGEIQIADGPEGAQPIIAALGGNLSIGPGALLNEGGLISGNTGVNIAANVDNQGFYSTRERFSRTETKFDLIRTVRTFDPDANGGQGEWTETVIDLGEHTIYGAVNSEEERSVDSSRLGVIQSINGGVSIGVDEDDTDGGIIISNGSLTLSGEEIDISAEGSDIQDADVTAAFYNLASVADRLIGIEGNAPDAVQAGEASTVNQPDGTSVPDAGSDPLSLAVPTDVSPAGAFSPGFDLTPIDQVALNLGLDLPAVQGVLPTTDGVQTITLLPINPVDGDIDPSGAVDAGDTGTDVADIEQFDPSQDRIDYGQRVIAALEASGFDLNDAPFGTDATFQSGGSYQSPSSSFDGANITAFAPSQAAAAIQPGRAGIEALLSQQLTTTAQNVRANGIEAFVDSVFDEREAFAALNPALAIDIDGDPDTADQGRFGVVRTIGYAGSVPEEVGLYTAEELPSNFGVAPGVSADLLGLSTDELRALEFISRLETGQSLFPTEGQTFTVYDSDTIAADADAYNAKTAEWTPGVAPTDAQIAALEGQPVVWEVDGEERIYFGSVKPGVDAGEFLFKDDLNVYGTVVRVSEDLAGRGDLNIFATGAVTIGEGEFISAVDKDGNPILNDNGEQVYVLDQDSLTVTGETNPLSDDERARLEALDNRTDLSQDFQIATYDSTDVTFGGNVNVLAGIQFDEDGRLVRDDDGNLVFNEADGAGHVVFQNANVTAGEAINVDARDSVTVGGYSVAYEQKWREGRWRHTLSGGEFYGSTLNAGTDLLIDAGEGGVEIVGSQLRAGDKAQITADGGITILEAQDHFNLNERYKKKGWLRSKTRDYNSYVSTNVGTDIIAGETLVESRDGTTTLVGVDLESLNEGAGLGIAGALEIVADAATEIASVQNHSSRSSFFGLINRSSSSSASQTFLDLNNFTAGQGAAINYQADTLTRNGVNEHSAVDLSGVTNLHDGLATETYTLSEFESEMGLVLATTETTEIQTDTIVDQLRGEVIASDVENYTYEVAVLTDIKKPEREPGEDNAAYEARVAAWEQEALSANPQTGPPAVTQDYIDRLEDLLGDDKTLTSVDVATALSDYHFHEETKNLSPAFKALATIVLTQGLGAQFSAGLLGSSAPTWLISATDKFLITAAIETTDGIVSGDLDIGKILEGATFAGVTAGLADGIKLNFPKGHPLNDALISGFGTDQLTFTGLMNAGLDGITSSGLSSIAYGTDFGEGVLASLTSYIADGIGGAAIEEVADVFGHGGFSLEKLISKALINCAVEVASGADCHAGVIGTLTSDLLTVYTEHTGDTLGAQTLEEYRNRIELASAIAGFFTSGGNPENVDAAAQSGQRDFDNNWVQFAVRAGIFAYSVYEVVDTARDVDEALDEMLADGELDADEAEQLQELAAAAGIQIVFDLTAGRVVSSARIVSVADDFTRRIAERLGLDDLLARIQTRLDGATSGQGNADGSSDTPQPGATDAEAGVAGAPNRTPQVVINQQNGAEFEQQVVDSLGHVGGAKNTTPVTVTLENGTQVTTIPDLWGNNVGGLLEAKNVQNLSMSNQLRAQIQVATETGQPLNLVVSPRTQTVSGPLVSGVQSTGGNVFVYNPATDTLTPW